jgi:hypothetical protein
MFVQRNCFFVSKRKVVKKQNIISRSALKKIKIFRELNDFKIKASIDYTLLF